MRPELGGKWIILGFFGLCPNVEINIPQLDQPVFLTFVLSGGPGDGDFEASFDVVEEKGQLVVASMGPVHFNAIPNHATVLAPAFLLTFGQPGTFAFRCVVDKAERYRGLFRVGQGSATQMPTIWRVG